MQTFTETCANISYDCSTDTVRALCGSNTPDVDAEHSSNYSSLPYASVSGGNIANAYGILECQTVSDYPPSGSADADDTSTCGSGSCLYKSRLDSSGMEAPDGVSELPCSIALLCDVMPVSGIDASSLVDVLLKPR